MKSDTRLQQDVMAELIWEPSVHVAQIGIEVKGSNVTLTGFVESWAERQSALHAVWSSPSVLNVADRMVLSF